MLHEDSLLNNYRRPKQFCIFLANFEIHSLFLLLIDKFCYNLIYACFQFALLNYMQSSSDHIFIINK